MGGLGRIGVGKWKWRGNNHPMLILLLPSFAAAERQTKCSTSTTNGGGTMIDTAAWGGGGGRARDRAGSGIGSGIGRGPPCLEETHCVSTWRSSRWRPTLLSDRRAVGFFGEVVMNRESRPGGPVGDTAGGRRVKKRKKSGGRRAMFCFLCGCWGGLCARTTQKKRQATAGGRDAKGEKESPRGGGGEKRCKVECEIWGNAGCGTDDGRWAMVDDRWDAGTMGTLDGQWMDTMNEWGA